MYKLPLWNLSSIKFQQQEIPGMTGAREGRQSLIFRYAAGQSGQKVKLSENPKDV